MNLIKIRTHLIRPEGSTFEGEFDTSHLLDGADTSLFSFTGAMKYIVHAQIVNGQLVLSGEASAPSKAICARCLCEFAQVLESEPFTFYFETLPEDGVLDITEAVCEELLVMIPDNPHCDETCLGLCPHCGVNRNQKACKCHEQAPKSSPWVGLDELKI